MDEKTSLHKNMLIFSKLIFKFHKSQAGILMEFIWRGKGQQESRKFQITKMM